jgi:hypothetical protein
MLIRLVTGALALVITTIAGITGPYAAAADYRFEAVGKPQASAGKSIVTVRLVHVPDSKTVPGAIIIQSKADMGPSGMADMTAPVQALPPKEPGIYRFEVQPGMAGKWMLSLAAKIQGEAETVRGGVTVELAK